jgi:hypothetical protein
MGLENLTCFRCLSRGHIAADCGELKPATSKAEHEARIARYVTRWTDGDITEWQKREYIRQENKLWYDGKVPSRLRSN